MKVNRSNNHKSGDGTLFDENEELLFMGSFINNKKNGLGILYQNKNILYRGEWKNNQKHGEGKLYYNNLNTIYYSGFFNENKNTAPVKFIILMVLKLMELGKMIF